MTQSPTFEAMKDVVFKAVAADAEALDVLVNSAYRGDNSRQGWTTEADLLDGTRTDAAAIREAILTPGTTILKYVENGEILGCVELVEKGEKMYLGMLTVSPQLQAKGIGKVIMHHAEELAASRGFKSMYMTVISVRSELIAWYERRGYHLTGDTKPFAFNDPRFGQPKTNLEFVVLEKLLRPV